MFRLTYKHLVLVLISIWLGYRNIIQVKKNFVKFTDTKVDYLPISPIDQSIHLKTVEETLSPMVGSLQGEIPTWLSGTLVRTGPGLFEFEHERALHVFDGMAMLRRFQIGRNYEESSELNYSRRLVQTEFLKGNLKEGRFTKYGMGTPSKGNMIDRLNLLSEPGADNVIVSCIHLFGHFYAVTEIPQFYEYDHTTLETIGKVDLTDYIPGIVMVTAHPLYDDDGTLWNLATATGPDRFGNQGSMWRYVIFKVTPPTNEEELRNPWSNLQIVSEKFSSSYMSISYMHSFFMTENYLIFTEQPWKFGNPIDMLIQYILLGKTMGSLMHWDDSSPLKFIVMDKSSGDILPIKYQADPMGFYHVVNSYEEGGYLVLDAPFKSGALSYDVLDMDKMTAGPEDIKKYLEEAGTAGRTRRWVLPLDVPSKFIEPEKIQIDDNGDILPSSYESLIKLPNSKAGAWHVDNYTVYLHPEDLAPGHQYQYHRTFEFGTINPNYIYKNYKYAYGDGFPSGFFASTIMKLNVVEKQFVGDWSDPSCHATEPHFIPRPGSTTEEDGVLLFVCIGTGITNLVILDPVDLTEIGRFTVPVTSSVGIHGIWMEDKTNYGKTNLVSD